MFAGMKKTLILIGCLALAGCGPSLVERRATEVCQRQGFSPGTQAWASCFGPVFAAYAL